MTTTTPAKSTTLPPAAPADLPPIPQPTFVKTNLPNGLPLYIIQHEAAFDEIEADPNCPPVYFCLAAVNEDNGETIPAKKVSWDEAHIFKRIANSAVGNGLLRTEVSDGLGLAVLKDVAYWTLPSMPQTLVNNIVGFFRAAYKKHGSESIVLLTYDPLYKESANPSDGWGLVVPIQENSAGSCDYKPESVAQEKPEHVDIVGSAHSHPGMSAFASHTDVKDQTNFDGLHMTAGWSNTTGGVIEWHVEYQLNNQRYNMTTKDVFESLDDEEWEDTEGWLDKVSKWTAPPSKRIGGGFTGGSGASGGGSASSKTPTPSAQYRAHFRTKHNSSRPSGCPDLVRNTVVVRLLDEEDACPICKVELSDVAIKHRRCGSCFSYLLLQDEEGKDILDKRKEQYSGLPYVPGLEYLFGKDPATNVMLWEREADKAPVIKCLWNPPSPKAVGIS